jgi:hypothetical protein
MARIVAIRIPVRIVLLISISILLLSFMQNSNEKIWDANSPLTWDDFQGIERSKEFDTKIVSNTFCGEVFRYKRLGNDSNSYVFKFEVRSVMVKNKSWVDPKYRTAELLQHEQLHFNISEYFSRQLLLALQNGKYTPNFRNEIRERRHKLSVQRETMQHLYDEQTRRSLNKKMQSKWNGYVANLLKSNDDLDKALKNLPQIDN